jgi:hypothetical protein
VVLHSSGLLGRSLAACAGIWNKLWNSTPGAAVLCSLKSANVAALFATEPANAQMIFHDIFQIDKDNQGQVSRLEPDTGLGTIDFQPRKLGSAILALSI